MKITMSLLLILLFVGCSVGSYTAKDALKGIDISMIQDKFCVRECSNTYSKCIGRDFVGNNKAAHMILRSMQEACGSALRICVETCE